MIDEKSAPKFFVQGTSPLVRMVFFTALSIALMASDARFNYLIKMRQAGVLVMQPLQWMANRPEAIYQGAKDFFITQSSLREQLADLRYQSLLQSAKLQQLESLEAENNHLKALLTLSSYKDFKVKPAEIIALINNIYSHKVMIDQGQKQGVVEGQPVIDEQGVIGQVTRTFSFSSEVTLLTDRDFAIPVQVERNGLRAIAYGVGNRDHISLPYMPSNVDLQKGDRLLTSGIDGTYPAGLLVAEIKQLKISSNSPFAIVHASPLAGVHNFRHVLLVEVPKASAAQLESSQIKQQLQSNTHQKQPLTSPEQSAEAPL
jgi:rod shape-determining protein MreC